MEVFDYLITCGKADQKPTSKQKEHRLDIGKGKDKIHLELNDIRKLLADNLSEAMIDLVEIATYVYVAGQLTSRGGIKELEYGLKWHRNFEFVIPIRCFDKWNENKSTLEKALDFVSGDSHKFNFIKKEHETPEFFKFNNSDEPDGDYTEAVLLSGGLDSFTGAMDEIVKHKNKAIFISHQSEKKMISLQTKVFNYVKENSDNNIPFHVPFRIFKGGEFVTKDTNQRNRSFLFAALAAMVADCLKLDVVKFYENGIISCNLPFDRQTYQAQRTISTHPKFFRLMNELLSNILNKDFKFTNPYFEKTRSEVVQKLIKLKHQAGISLTRSCASSRYSNGCRHDGTCSQCVDRRFSTLANDCLKYDSWNDYRINIFVDELEKTHDRTMVYNYAGLAKKIRTMPDVHKFRETFSTDLIEIVNNLEINRQKGVQQIYDLYKRHSESVFDVLDLEWKTHSSEMLEDKLPQNCLLNLIRFGKTPKYNPNGKKVKKSERSSSALKHWKNYGDACFIVSGNRVKFYYDDNEKDMRLRSDSRANTLITALAQNTLTQEEVKGLICSAKTKPADAVKNINKSLNKKIISLGFKIPSNVKFITLDDRSKQYCCAIPIGAKSPK